MFLGQGADLVGGDVTGHDQDRVIGRVEPVVIGHRVFEAQLLHLMAPADDRHAVAMVEVLRRHGLFAEQRLGRVFGPLVAFLDDDLAFGQDVGLGEADIAHPVCFHRHHQRQPVSGDALEIGGVIEAGEGVVGAAVFGDDLGQLSAFQVVGGLEQQVFQEMRHARGAGRLVRRSGAIPDHVDDDGGAMILDHHDVHAVIKREIGDKLVGGGCGECGQKGQGGGPGHQAGRQCQTHPGSFARWGAADAPGADLSGFKIDGRRPHATAHGRIETRLTIV